jgi:ribonuclease BN (tRNA processing enzyme)
MESYGYRFDTPDRSIVISGDTNPTQATIDACRGCDVLIHEVD